MGLPESDCPQLKEKVMENRNEEMEIDLLGLFRYLKKRIVIIVAACLVCAVAGFLFTKLFITPEYTAETRMYVLNRTNANSVVSADFSVSNYMLNDYKVLITGQNVTKKVIDHLGLDMKPSTLSGLIKVTSPDDTRVLQINITHTDPKKAADIANCVREVASEQIQEIMAVNAVKLVYEAEVPPVPSGPSTMRNTALAGILGLVLTVGIYTVIFILDDTIRTEEDVMRYLGLGTLGVIPVSLDMGALGTNRTDKKPGSKKAASKPAPKAEK